MPWLIIAFIVLPAIGVLLLLPYSSFRLARENCTRANGTRSKKRASTERKAVTDFGVTIILIPLIVVAVVGTTLIIVHEFIAPIPLLLDVMGAYQTNVEAWEHAIEREGLGDVGAHYEAWSRNRGFADTTARFWQEILWDHWPTVLIVLILIAGVFYVAVSRIYISASVQYQSGVTERAETYRQYDLEQAESATFTG